MSGALRLLNVPNDAPIGSVMSLTVAPGPKDGKGDV